MAEQEGLNELRGLVERRARSVPPPRRPRGTEESAATPAETGSRGPEPQPPIVGPDHEPQGSAGPEPAWEGPGVAQPAVPAPPATSEPSVPSETPRTPPAEPRSVPAQSPRPSDPASKTFTGPEPTANLTLRIRQSLDLRLVELLHSLRRDGVRSSKKELIEMCLSELPFEPSEQLRVRLRAYRETVPKEPL